MNDGQFEALAAAASSGVSFDGLSVWMDDGTYVVETPDRHGEATDETRLRDLLEAESAYVRNWHYWRRELGDMTADRYAFLRWLAHAEQWDVPTRADRLSTGIEREWGQLHIEVRREDGPRRYRLRHVADRGTDRDTLDVRTDPLAARELARFDDDGRYRPLKTAPSLATGWAFPELSAPELLQAVESFYPATITNWHLEREGELDVTGWADTAQRQTGIYGVVQELPEQAVEWATRACCVDSQCLKRREWDIDEDRPLETPRGDGEFPCREPCSLLIAAAREWATLEREETRTVELELTPSEHEQLEEIVDAVAEGRVDEIREADVDDGANRYRARYLRAKRFDDDVESEPFDDDGEM